MSFQCSYDHFLNKVISGLRKSLIEHYLSIAERTTHIFKPILTPDTGLQEDRFRPPDDAARGLHLHRLGGPPLSEQAVTRGLGSGRGLLPLPPWELGGFMSFFLVWRCFWVSFLCGQVLFESGWPLDGLNGMIHEFGRHRAREFRNGEYGKEFRERLTLPFPKTLKARNP